MNNNFVGKFIFELSRFFYLIYCSLLTLGLHLSFKLKQLKNKVNSSKLNKELFRIIIGLLWLIDLLAVFVYWFLNLLSYFVFFIDQALLKERSSIYLLAKSYLVKKQKLNKKIISSQNFSQEVLLTCIYLNNYSIQKGKIFFHFLAN